MSSLHTWGGLLVGWILYFIFLTGTLGYFDTEIDRWMRPELPLRSSAISAEETVERGLIRLNDVAPAAERWRVELAHRGNDTGAHISWRTGRARDGAPGVFGYEPLEEAGTAARRTGGGQLLYQMHYRLHYLDENDAAWIVGFCAMSMLVTILSGVICHKRIFRDFFTFRPRKGARSWLDAHNVLGVLALPFHIMITYSGLVFFMFMYMPYVLDEVYRLDETSQLRFFDNAYPSEPEYPRRSGAQAPLAPIEPILLASAAHGGQLVAVAIHNPGDATARIVVTRAPNTVRSAPQRLTYDGVTGEPIEAPGAAPAAQSAYDALIGLHEGLFAGPFLRWLYFVSGLMGSGMIATGLVLWTVKRGSRQTSGSCVHAVGRLNAVTIIGLPIGIAAYFWANRLLPVDFEHRATWEAHTLFGSWAFTLIHAVMRPVKRAWIELPAVASALFFLLPLINALTTDRHLGVTLPHDGLPGDWALAGFDLTALAVGLIFGATAWYLRVRQGHALSETESASLPVMRPRVKVLR